MNLLTEFAPDFSTRRKCSVCLAPATRITVKGDQAGDFDKTSKQYRCAEHFETITPDWLTSKERIAAKTARAAA